MTTEAIVYTADGVERYGDIAAARRAQGTTWVSVTDAGHDELRAVAETYDVHRLHVEDVENNVRPKVELLDEYTFLLIKAATLRRGETTFSEEIRDESIGLFVGEDWLVTMATTDPDPVRSTWDRVRRRESRVLRRGPDFAAYHVFDRVTDEYFEIIDELERDIERVEDDVVEATDPGTLAAINSLRRELLSVRHLVWPTRDVAAALYRGDADQIGEETQRYYRDVYDHLVQLVELTETYRDLARGAREVYLNALSQSTNEVMKRLTVVATVILPLTFVVGVYGMNFDGGPYNLPELSWTYGYPAVMLGMAATALVLLAYFRREGWM